MQPILNNSAMPELSIAIVSSSLSRLAGGILPIMQAQARYLAGLGISVAAFGVADEFSETDSVSWSPIEPHYFAPRHRRFAYAPQMGRAMLAAPIDIVHQHGLWLYPSLATSRWRKRHQRPVIISTQGMLEPWALSNSIAKKRIASALFEWGNLSGASCLHCSQAEVEGVRRFGLRNPIAVLSNGAELPTIKAPSVRPSWLPADGRRTLLFLGRLHPKKGLRETLTAWSHLRSGWPEIARQWRLVIAGWDDGGHRECLISQSRDLGLANEVLFPGPLFGDEKEAAFAHADAFVLASYSEGLPIAVLEAWSHALPVFMTRECNLAEGFSAGAAVEVTTDPEKLALTFAQTLVSPELSSMGHLGQKLVAQRFSWDVVVRNLLDVYRWLASGAERPTCVLVD